MTWKNTRTMAFRALSTDFERLKPMMDVMRFSIQFNPQWVVKESQGQQERAKIALKVFDEIRRIDREIVSRTTINRQEIMNDNFLVLTGQEEYINPHSGEVEMDTDAYRCRWKTPGGDVYYTNREDEDPNIFLQRGDYSRTLIRKRKNEWSKRWKNGRKRVFEGQYGINDTLVSIERRQNSTVQTWCVLLFVETSGIIVVYNG